MRSPEQIEKLTSLYLDGATKTAALIGGGYSPRWAQSNTDKVLPRVNQRHILFARNLFTCGWNKTKAAIAAGYNPRWAKTNTDHLMKHPEVQAEIERIRRSLIFGD